MKLLAKYNSANILATIMVLLIGGFFYYCILHYVLLDQLDSDLKIEQLEITDYVKANNRLPNVENYKNQKVKFESTTLPVKRAIYSSVIFSVADDENITTRQIIFPIVILGKPYKASIAKSQNETEDLIQLIVSITLGIVTLLLLVLFIINRFMLNKLWLPFNNTLSQLKQFNLSSKSSLILNDSSIDEFKELNTAITAMSNQVIKDYDSLKSFTENASHEIQTPLAIINSKLELLIQSENFTETQMQVIQTIHDEIRRLSKLNQSLLLLTKIDNQQFQETEAVDIAEIINRHLYKYEELITAKQISLIKDIEKIDPLIMNETMADMLISNLITNAIKHNVEKGTINIVLKENKLVVSNTGIPLVTSTNELFERFKKDNVNSESLGLGLSIVKKICERYNFNIKYTSIIQLHKMTIHFLQPD